MNTHQAIKVLKINQESSQDEIKKAYRKMVLEHHPDKNQNQNEDLEFKKINEAYNFLKKNKNSESQENTIKPKTNFRPKPQWGAPGNTKTPEQDWGKYTKEFEEGDPDFWKEYEAKFWEEYNARIRADGKNGEFDKAKEPKEQPNLFVSVDESLCIGCCSCETIAPNVFEINKKTQSNPKSSVINQKGSGINKIMTAAETCPTKAINVDNIKTKERLYPY